MLFNFNFFLIPSFVTISKVFYQIYYRVLLKTNKIKYELVIMLIFENEIKKLYFVGTYIISVTAKCTFMSNYMVFFNN